MNSSKRVKRRGWKDEAQILSLCPLPHGRHEKRRMCHKEEQQGELCLSAWAYVSAKQKKLNDLGGGKELSRNKILIRVMRGMRERAGTERGLSVPVPFDPRNKKGRETELAFAKDAGRARSVLRLIMPVNLDSAQKTVPAAQQS